MKLKLIQKFILSLGFLGAVLTVAISFFSYNASKSYLEDMYAQRVTSGSESIAHILSLEDVRTILAPGGEQSAAYTRTAALLDTLKRDGEITYLSLVVPDEDSVTFYIDTCLPELGDDPAAQIPYGSDILYTDAASDERDLENYLSIWQLYAKNTGTSAPLTTDNAYGYNYTSVTPILDESGQAIAEIQYILDMQQVRDHLNSYLMTMLLISLAIVCLAMLGFVILVRVMVTKPIGRLADFTRNITSTGVFENQHIAITTGDEIEELGSSFNYMLEELERYIHNLSKVTAEKERIGAELDVAAKIQADMLPCIFPAFPERHEFDIHATMTPAKEVGGDFYDFFLVDEDHLALVMADVSGKGVPAALFMMISKTLIKSAAQVNLSPKEILEKVNNQLCENNDAEMFVTVWLGILEISTGKMKCANAGHEYPAILRKGGAFELFKDRHGFVLAGMENSRYREYDLTLAPGDALFVYTDGVAEATDAHNELYGTDRMLTALNDGRDLDCEALLEHVHRDVNRFVGEAPQFDDITMLCLKIAPSGSEPMHKLNILPSLAQAGEATAFFEQLLTQGGAPAKVIASVNVAVDEIFSNISQYSGATMATLGCTVTPGLARICFSDNGKPYDPTQTQAPDITLSAEERSIGGLGIFMVRKMMDTVSYAYTDGFNVLTLEKKW